MIEEILDLLGEKIPFTDISYINIILMIIVLVVGYFITTFISKYLKKSMLRAKMSEILAEFARRIVKIMLLIFVFAFAIGFLGIDAFAGILSLSELIALIDKADIFIANSTGPLHIAAALGKYIVGFYPNLLVCSAKRWGPYTNKKIVFSPKKECSDCEREQCTKSECMNSIEVKDVVGEIDKICNFISDNGEDNV